MKSMTGYGQGVAEVDGVRASVEIRSVNHRFRDIKVRGSGLSAALEDELVRKVHKHVERGSVTISVRTQVESAHSLKVDQEAARRIYGELRALAANLNMETEIDLALITAQPGVLVAGETDNQGAIGVVVARAMEAGLSALVLMRAAEGESLRKDFAKRFAALRGFVDKIAMFAAQASETAKDRLEERISRLLANASVEVDDSRLAHEVAILADRSDITEEIVRLRSHFDQLDGMLEEQAAVGRRIGFLMQELGREFNTIGSKSQSVEIAKILISAKAELEKIREQIQNVE